MAGSESSTPAFNLHGPRSVVNVTHDANETSSCHSHCCGLSKRLLYPGLAACTSFRVPPGLSTLRALDGVWVADTFFTFLTEFFSLGFISCPRKKKTKFLQKQF